MWTKMGPRSRLPVGLSPSLTRRAANRLLTEVRITESRTSLLALSLAVLPFKRENLVC